MLLAREFPTTIFMISSHIEQQAALEELSRLAPDIPFLTLGQTIFWDEPVKMGVVQQARKLGFERSWVTAIHDADYFAKLPRRKNRKEGYQALAHNDTTTKDLWTAAAEFSTLFGSETVLTQERLLEYGLKVSLLAKLRSDVLNEGTEAWGWRGIVSNERNPKIIAQTPLTSVIHVITETFLWAINQTLDCLSGTELAVAQKSAEELLHLVTELALQYPEASLSDFYKLLLPSFYQKIGGSVQPNEVTSTVELLKFNKSTYHLPRFKLLEIFIDPGSNQLACDAYNESIINTEIYQLERFGEGAIPFDLVIPNIGRGTVRVLSDCIIINAANEVVLKISQPIQTLAQLAEEIETHLGPECAFVGKAITLIGMMAHEFVFVFHEGASLYVEHSKTLHEKLRNRGISIRINPILRVAYPTWDALETTDFEFTLPQPLKDTFGTKHVHSSDFARRWHGVVKTQEELLAEFKEVYSLGEWIRFLAKEEGDPWIEKALEYEVLSSQLDEIYKKLEEIREEKNQLLEQIESLQQQRIYLERKKGRHWRTYFYEKHPLEEHFEERKNFEEKISQTIEEVRNAKDRWRTFQAQQDALAKGLTTQEIRRKKTEIEVEAEIERLRWIRNAVISSEGLRKAGFRPSWWWFFLLDPQGTWIQQAIEGANFYLESL